MSDFNNHSLDQNNPLVDIRLHPEERYKVLRQDMQTRLIDHLAVSVPAVLAALDYEKVVFRWLSRRY